MIVLLCFLSVESNKILSPDLRFLFEYKIVGHFLKVRFYDSIADEKICQIYLSSNNFTLIIDNNKYNVNAAKE